MKDLKDLKIALVHDFLVNYGGAERVLEVLSEMFPKAPIYTLLYDKEKMRGKFKGKEIQTSYLQKFPKFLRKRYQWLLPFFPMAPETLDFREFDLVISSSGAWSKGIVTKLNTIHVAYIHSPMRFVWDYNERYLKEDRKERCRFLSRPFLSYLRLWDRLAADRPDYLIANSKYTKNRIQKYYRKDSTVIYPPVTICDNNPEEKTKKQKYFLTVARLSPYKKLAAIVEAFNKMELPLVIIGEGLEEERLRSIAKSNIQILGWQDDKKLLEYYQSARGFISASLEDFGMVAVEAMSQGLPVVALSEGGSGEIIEEGKTGEFFASPMPEVIADGVRRFLENEDKYDREYIIEQVKKFNADRFKREFGEFLEKIYDHRA